MDVEVLFHYRVWYPTKSDKTRTETISAPSLDEVFRKFYAMNKRLRYCNDNWYSFVDEEWMGKAYRDWYVSLSESERFEMYYGKNGIVD